MEAMELLHTRYSALRLGEPAPSPQALSAMLESAARVPDHDRLKPWRLILVDGDARVRLGETLAEALARRNPQANPAALAREKEKALRAPLIVVVATKCDRSSKIPIIEQVMSAGCAAHGIMQAAFAQGFGTMWRTGDACYDDTVKSALGIEPDDYIAGFIYVGTEIAGGVKPRPERPTEEFARHWTGSPVRPPSA
jgi:nitroreductase